MLTMYSIKLAGYGAGLAAVVLTQARRACSESQYWHPNPVLGPAVAAAYISCSLRTGQLCALHTEQIFMYICTIHSHIHRDVDNSDTWHMLPLNPAAAESTDIAMTMSTAQC